VLLTINHEEPIDKCHRKCQESSSEKKRKDIDEHTLLIVEIATDPEYRYHHDSSEDRREVRWDIKIEQTHHEGEESKYNKIILKPREHLVLQESIEEVSMEFYAVYIIACDRRYFAIIDRSAGYSDKYIFS
jgi:hypothetical protein